MCFILVYVMFMQFKSVEETDITSIKNMREAELRSEISSIKGKYNEVEEKLIETQEKIQEYKDKTDNNLEASELLEKELQTSNLIIGKTDVQGEGIVITLSNGQYDDEKITALDLLVLINELRLAGAEAISINEERIVNMTDIVDISSHIRINKQRMTSPYVIKAVGNQTYLESGITAKDGYVDQKINEGKSIKVEKEKNIQIAKYSEGLSLNSINY